MGLARLVLAGTTCLAALAGACVATASRPACPPLLAASHLPHVGPSARADVDADGTLDRAWIGAQPSAPGFCGILLAVRTRRGLTAVRVPGSSVGRASASVEHGLPRLFGLLQLDGKRELEAVVIVDRGAAAVSFAVYRLIGDRLDQVAVPGSPTNRLEWADGARTIGRVDCAATAESTRVRDAFAERQADGTWLLTRRTYRLTDAKLAAVQAQSAVLSARPKLPAGLPFAHCAGLRAGG